jgi:YebC/PmpR family DNA-binding regulatory protein
MGAQWKFAGKAAGAAQKGAIVHKLIKEITVASRMGGPDPGSNPRLRAGVEAARKQSVSRDTIERAIKRGAGLLDETITYELVTYEGFAPHQVPVIVECLTDNKTRTASDIRLLFKKGQLGTPGSVGWMFDRLGIIEAVLKDKAVDIESVAIEAGAQNVELQDGAEIEDDEIGARFFSDLTDLDSVNKFLTANKWTISQSDLGYVAKNKVVLTPEKLKEVSEFLNEINQNDDVHRVYVGL